MKVPDRPSVKPVLDAWTSRLERATRTPVGRSGEVRHDLKKVAASDRLQKVAAARLDGIANASPLERAKQVWSNRGHGGIPELAERVSLEDPDEDFRALLAGADAATLASAVDELALRVLATEGPDAALSRLLDMKVVCEAGRELVPEHNRRMRSTPRHLRGERLPPELEGALEVLQDRLREVKEEIESGGFMARVRGGAGELSQTLFDAGKSLIARFEGSEGDRGFLKKTWDRLLAAGGALVPQAVKARLAAITDGASALVKSLKGVEADRNDPDALVDRLCSGLRATRATLDPTADAVAVGLLNETTAGMTAASGHELIYLREEGKIRLNRVVGTGARLGVGGSLRAYTTNAYGTPEALSGSTGRSSLEVGAVVANLAFNRGHSGTERGSRSFSTVFSIGVTASLPFLDGQALSTMSERNLSTLDLSEAQVAKLEAELEQVSSKARRWTGFVGRLVRSDKAPVPEPVDPKAPDKGAD